MHGSPQLLNAQTRSSIRSDAGELVEEACNHECSSVSPGSGVTTSVNSSSTGGGIPSNSIVSSLANSTAVSSAALKKGGAFTLLGVTNGSHSSSSSSTASVLSHSTAKAIAGHHGQNSIVSNGTSSHLSQNAHSNSSHHQATTQLGQYEGWGTNTIIDLIPRGG